MQWIQNLIHNYLPLVSDNPLIQAALIFLLTVIISKLVQFIIGRLQKHAAARTKNTFDDHLFETFKKPIGFSILLVGIYLAAVKSGLFTSEKSEYSGLDILESILVTFAIFVWLKAIIKFSRLVLGFLSDDKNTLKVVQKHTLPLFENLAVIVFYALAIYFILVAWNINVSAWIASAGILGLALSFAAKDTLANLFAGVFILADAPYKIGDFIVLDTGERGMVTHIGIRSTRILTRADVEINIPNAIMGNTKIINETAGPHSKYRIAIKIGVAYGSDLSQVRSVLLEAAEQVSDVEKLPAARVRFRGFGDSALEFELLCWVA